MQNIKRKHKGIVFHDDSREGRVVVDLEWPTGKRVVVMELAPVTRDGESTGHDTPEGSAVIKLRTSSRVLQ